MKITLIVNDKTADVQVDDPDMPLLYALRDDLALRGPRFGCGLAQCGACTVHIDGKAMRSCVYPVSSVGKGKVTTVEVNRKTGALRVKHFAVVQDCGQVINPDGVKNQIEGNVVQTVSRTLKEQLTFDRSRVTSVDWASYPILTFPDIPDVDIELIDRPAEKPWGVGEPSATVVPAAIENAVCDAVGVRLRSVPFLPEKVLAALPSA